MGREVGKTEDGMFLFASCRISRYVQYVCIYFLTIFGERGIWTGMSPLQNTMQGDTF